MKKKKPQVGDPDFKLPLVKDHLKIGKQVNARLPRVLTSMFGCRSGRTKSIRFKDIAAELHKLTGSLTQVEALIRKSGGDLDRLELMYDGYCSWVDYFRIMKPEEIERYMKQELAKIDREKRKKEQEKRRKEAVIKMLEKQKWEREHAEEARQKRILEKIRLTKMALGKLEKENRSIKSAIEAKNPNQHKAKS